MTVMSVVSNAVDVYDVAWSLLLGAVIAEAVIALRFLPILDLFWLLFAEWRWRRWWRIRRSVFRRRH
ncbi:hypothetical protein [Actinoalloteichus sp. GBA129-24]|uniref:hypothetical protein n=1 Tax=Actinoalloteichus sp. GBA129-24 TaxID=1612551 RepID=UPI0009504C96|nr:hypothetical protein [Actinoalloteichus sp. GBA129-24]APU22931.1 hypothetical protein UA75_24760 [Actinoalloteichus sp. GBA129-24]